MVLDTISWRRTQGSAFEYTKAEMENHLLALVIVLGVKMNTVD